MSAALAGYRAGKLLCEAYVARPDGAETYPAVLIAPTVRGPTDAEFRHADMLTAREYAGVVIDLYGKDRRNMAPEEARAQMDSLLADRALLRERLLAAFAFVRGLDRVDPARIAAIGFCFGGLCVLDLARSGADVRGVVSFHGLLKPPKLGEQEPVQAKLLALHGWDDPLAPPSDVLAFAEEMTAAGADWQLHAYGGVAHAFTNPAANMPEKGLVYNERANARGWAAAHAFLDEVLA